MGFWIKTGSDISAVATKDANRSFRMAFGFTTALFLLILLCFPVRYETNDDFALVCELSGYSPTPVSFVLNPITSHCLYYLYHVLPKIPWYGLWLYGCIYLGISLLTAALFRINDRFLLLLLGPFFIVLFFRSIAFPGITTTSLLLLIAVFLSFLEWGIKSNSPSSHPRAYLCLLAGGLVMGFSLRWELVTYALVFITPVILHFKPSDRPYYRSLLLGLACIICLYPVFMAYLTSGDRQSFQEYSTLRKVFHDTERGDYRENVTPLSLKKAGWSYEDYLVFRQWFIYDTARFNKKTLSAFLGENNPMRGNNLIKNGFDKILTAFRKNLQDTLLFFLSALVVLLYRARYPMAFSRFEIGKRIFALLMIFIGILFFAYYRFEPRIYLPLYTFFLGTMAIALFPDLPDRSTRKKSMNILLSVVAALLLAGTTCLAFSICTTLLSELSASYRDKQYIQRQFNNVRLNEMDKDNSLLVVLNPRKNLMTETIHPLKERSDYNNFKILPFGWQINSPQYRRMLDEFGISDSDDFLQWTINNRNVIWFQLFWKATDKQFMLLIEEYITQHFGHGEKVFFQPVFDFRNQVGIGFVFFNLVSKKDFQE